MSEGTEAQWGFMFCPRSQFAHENLNPDLSASFFILYPISMIPNQLWKMSWLISKQVFPNPRWTPVFLPSYDHHHLLLRCLDNLELPLSKPQGLAQLWQHWEQCQLSWFPWKKKEKKKSCSQRQLYLTIPFSSLFLPSETSNPLSVHLLPRPIPVTGRPCGLFNVTSGPETYITWTSLMAKAAVYKVLSQFTLSCGPTTTLMLSTTP